MEALSNIQETEKTLQLVEEETRQLKEELIEEENDLSENVETLEIRNKEAMALIKDLEAQVESLNNEKKRLEEVEALIPSLTKASEDGLLKIKSLEEQVMSKVQENGSLKDEIDSLVGKVSKLEEMVNTMKNDHDGEVENSNLENKRLSFDKEVLEEKILKLETQVEENKAFKEKLLELEDMVIQKEEELADLNKKLSLVENTKAELTSKITKQEQTIKSLQGDSLQAKARLLQAVERKMDELGGEFKKSFEMNISIMKQRIRVAEQFQTENKETCRMIKEKCQREHSGLDKKVQAYSRMIATSKGRISKFFNSTDGTLAGLETSFNRFGEKEADFARRISSMADEIVAMKNRYKEKEEIRKLEEKINKEKGEHWRLRRKVNELQRRVDALEKSAVEKEEAIFELVDEKKDAIRQLCNTVEYHKNRCDQLAKLLYVNDKDRSRD